MASELRWLDGIVGSWFIAGNWTPAQVPASGDTATIGSGTAIVSGTGSVAVLGEAIILDSASDNTTATLHAINAQFAGDGTGATEVNTTLTVSGAFDETTKAAFIVEGNTSFDGQIFVQAIGGSLTIYSVANGASAGTFTLLNTDDKATVIVSQESFLDFEGQFFVNQGVIEIEGTAEISAGAVFSGTDGVFVLENGGRLIVEGTVNPDQQIVFFDGTGKLFIDNAADFRGVIGFVELPPQPGQPPLGIAGARIYLEGIEAQSLNFVMGSDGRGVLNLYAETTPSGQPIAHLTMEMVASQLEPLTTSSLSTADFVLGSDGHGGTLITYAPQGSTYLLASLPKPVIAAPNDVVALTSILQDSFGTPNTPFDGVWLFPSAAYENSKTDVGYWSLDPSDQVTPAWYIGTQRVDKPIYVTDISNVTLHAGNQIDSPLSFQIGVTEALGGPAAEFITYNVWTVDPQIVSKLADYNFQVGAPPTAETVVAAANAFIELYGQGTIPNTNLCDWIADNVAAGAGATMPFPNADLDPSLNKEGGFWRIAYQASGEDPVSDWSNLVKPGDIVRMGWFSPEAGRISGHTTTVLAALNSEGKIEFYDNNDDHYIGHHFADYWLNTNPTDITIYRIDENQQYLIEGTELAEVIRGSVFDNLIRPGGGADVITGGANDTEIEGSAAQLNGITVTDFNSGDSFNFTDLDPGRTSALYFGGELHVYENFREVARIELTRPADGLFVVTSDGDGGATVELGTPRQFVESYIHKIFDWLDCLFDRLPDAPFDWQHPLPVDRADMMPNDGSLSMAGILAPSTAVLPPSNGFLSTAVLALQDDAFQFPGAPFDKLSNHVEQNLSQLFDTYDPAAHTGQNPEHAWMLF